MSDQETSSSRQGSGRPFMNRRDADRIALTPAYSSVAVMPDEAESPLDGHVYDISGKGLRFEVDEPLPVGAAIVLELQLPAGSPIRATARVVRVFDEVDDPGPRRMGAEFTAFDSAIDEARLERLLDSCAVSRAA